MLILFDILLKYKYLFRITSRYKWYALLVNISISDIIEQNIRATCLIVWFNYILLLTRSLLIATRPYNWSCTFDHLAKLYFLHLTKLMPFCYYQLFLSYVLLFCRGATRNKRSLSPSERILCTSWTNCLQRLLCLRRWGSRGIYLLSWTLFWWVQGCM